MAASMISAHMDLDHADPESSATRAKRVKTHDQPPAKPLPKPQSSLHRFWGGQDHSVPAYFVLEWPGKTAAYFSRSRPQGLSVGFEASFEWRDQNKTIFLLSTIAPSPSANGSLPPETVYKNMGLLKSHLQKCVRRSHTQLAVKTALTILRLNPGELLRRLPIIMLEDAHLFPASFISLVWLMAATSKGFALTDDLVAWILGAVAQIAGARHRDPQGSIERPVPLATAAISEMAQTDRRDLIYALQLRRSFGGMGGDMNMLNAATQCWLERSVEQWAVVSKAAVSPLDPKDVEPLMVEEWELAAIDYHCSNVLIRFVEEKRMPGYTMEQLQHLMWSLSSSVTDKEPLFNNSSQDAVDASISASDRAAWAAARPPLLDIARSILFLKK